MNYEQCGGKYFILTKSIKITFWLLNKNILNGILYVKQIQKLTNPKHCHA